MYRYNRFWTFTLQYEHWSAVVFTTINMVPTSWTRWRHQPPLPWPRLSRHNDADSSMGPGLGRQHWCPVDQQQPLKWCHAIILILSAPMKMANREILCINYCRFTQLIWCDISWICKYWQTQIPGHYNVLSNRLYITSYSLSKKSRTVSLYKERKSKR